MSKRIAIIIDYAPGSVDPDLSDVALVSELNLQEVLHASNVEATVFDDMHAAREFLETPSDRKHPQTYLDYKKEPIGGGNPYYRCAHCKRSDPEINGRLEGHEPWCEYRLAKE